MNRKKPTQQRSALLWGPGACGVYKCKKKKKKTRRTQIQMMQMQKKDSRTTIDD